MSHTPPSIEEKLRKQGYVTATEAAELIGCSSEHVHQLGRNEKIKAVRIGDGVRAPAFYEWASILEHYGPEQAKLLSLPAKLPRE